MDTAMFSNATLAMQPASYLSHFANVTQAMPHLNLFEVTWASYYNWMANDQIATGVMSFVMHEAVYFGRSLSTPCHSSLPHTDNCDRSSMDHNAVYSILSSVQNTGQ